MGDAERRTDRFQRMCCRALVGRTDPRSCGCLNPMECSSVCFAHQKRQNGRRRCGEGSSVALIVDGGPKRRRTSVSWRWAAPLALRWPRRASRRSWCARSSNSSSDSSPGSVMQQFCTGPGSQASASCHEVAFSSIVWRCVRRARLWQASVIVRTRAPFADPPAHPTVGAPRQA